MMPPVKMKVMSMVHGKSEYCICCSIKSNLKIKHEIIARDKGKSNIQVTSILDILNDSRFRSYKNFIRVFSDVECKKGKLLNFKLFIIMDVDDCTIDQKKQFKSKIMFKQHWLYDYIVPIFSEPNLESTMKDVNIEINRKKDYFTVFPTNHGDLNVDTAKEFLSKLKPCKCSNLCEYIEYCLLIADQQLLK